MLQTITPYSISMSNLNPEMHVEEKSDRPTQLKLISDKVGSEMRSEYNSEHHIQSLITPPKRKLVIFDLDETLIYNTRNTISNTKPLIIPRPFYYDMLTLIHPFYDIWVWSASHPSYIKAVVSKLDPSHKFISKILSREDCIHTKSGYFIKDATKFINLDPTQYLIFDNLYLSFINTPLNGRLVSSFTGSRRDNELSLIACYLLEIKDSIDLRYD
jgi:CTD small phosphatase-like protein 2